MTDADPTTGATRYAGLTRADVDAHPATEVLRRRYRAYRTRQGRDLLALIPREGVRELLKAYRRDAERDGAPELDALAVFVADRLPLPPFGVWLEDFHRHRADHLALTDPPLSDGPASVDGAPVTTDVRTFQAPDGDEWVASLTVRAAGPGWHGAIHFHRPPDIRAFPTTDVFRESDVTAVRDRFSSLDRATLQAFLRSVLP